MIRISVLILLITHTFISCNEDKSGISNNRQTASNELIENQNQNALEDEKLTFPKAFIGEWSHCLSEAKDGTRMNYNVCGTIFFKEDGAAVYRNAGNEDIPFKWGVNETGLVLKRNAGEKAFFTEENHFLYSFEVKESLTLLAILTKDGFKYLLSKEN